MATAGKGAFPVDAFRRKAGETVQLLAGGYGTGDDNRGNLQRAGFSVGVLIRLDEFRRDCERYSGLRSV